MQKVKLRLEGLNGNAMALMGAFAEAARKQGIDKAEVEAVLTQCKSGDYDNLLRVLMKNTEDVGMDARTNETKDAD